MTLYASSSRLNRTIIVGADKFASQTLDLAALVIY